MSDLKLIAVIGEEDVIVGFLDIGVGDYLKENYLVVTNKTSQETIIHTFNQFTNRQDILIILITHHVAEMIRPTLSQYRYILPSVVEIPSRDSYNPNKDLVMIKINKLLNTSIK